MKSEYFDPKPDAPYGHCLDCPEVFASREEMFAHLEETHDPRRVGRPGHRGRTDNPSRPEKIEQHISGMVEDAINSLLDEIGALVLSEAITLDEAKAAVAEQRVELEDAYAEYLKAGE